MNIFTNCPVRHVGRSDREDQTHQLMEPSTSNMETIRMGTKRTMLKNSCRNAISSADNSFDSCLRRTSYCKDHIAYNFNRRFRSSSQSSDSILITNTSKNLLTTSYDGHYVVYKQRLTYCSNNCFSKIVIRRSRRRNRTRNWHSVYTKLLAQVTIAELIFVTMLSAAYAFVMPPPIPRNSTADPADATTGDLLRPQVPAFVNSTEAANATSTPNYDQITEIVRPVYYTATTTRIPVPEYSPSLTTKQQFFNTIGVPVYSRAHPDSFFFRDAFSSAYAIKITKESWNAYDKFKKDTCREEVEMPIDGKILNSTDSGYFTWEENIFHQELRKIILPQTRTNRLTPLIGTSYLRTLDSRFFMSAPKSMCRSQKFEMDDEELQKLERQHFEDYLINKIFSRDIWSRSNDSDEEVINS